MPKLKYFSQIGSTTEYNEDVRDSINKIIQFARGELSNAMKGNKFVDGAQDIHNKDSPNDFFNICDDKVLLHYYPTLPKLTPTSKSNPRRIKQHFLSNISILHENYFEIWNKDHSDVSLGASGSDILLLKDKEEVILVIKFIRKDEYNSLLKYNVPSGNQSNFTIGAGATASPLNYAKNPTLLVPAIAYFKTETEESKDFVYGVIMPGIEPTNYTMKFDLKGSLSGRIVKQKKIKKEGKKATLKDQNLFSKIPGGPSIVAPGAYEWKEGDWSKLLKDSGIDTVNYFKKILDGLDDETGENINCLQQSGIPHNSYAWRFINFMTYYVIGPLILSSQDNLKSTWPHVFSNFKATKHSQIKDFWTRLISDVTVLSKHKVMDYSLLLYVTEETESNNLFKINIVDEGNNNTKLCIYVGIIDYLSYGPCPNNISCGSTPRAQMLNSFDVDKSIAFKAQMMKKNFRLCPSKKSVKYGPNKEDSPKKVTVPAAAAAAAAGGKKQKRKRTQKRKRRKNRRTKRK